MTESTLDVQPTRDRPGWAILVAVLTAVYVAMFQVPALWAILRFLWLCVRGAKWGMATALIVQLCLLLLALGIWLASVWLTGCGCYRLRKAVYALLLAYLLLPTITSPVNYAARWVGYLRYQKQLAALPADQRQAILQKTTVLPPTLAVTRLDLALPIAPTLLLLAIWFLCKSDGVSLPRYFSKTGPPQPPAVPNSTF